MRLCEMVRGLSRTQTPVQGNLSEGSIPFPATKINSLAVIAPMLIRSAIMLSRTEDPCPPIDLAASR